MRAASWVNGESWAGATGSIDRAKPAASWMGTGARVRWSTVRPARAARNLSLRPRAELTTSLAASRSTSRGAQWIAQLQQAGIRVDIEKIGARFGVPMRELAAVEGTNQTGTQAEA